MSSEIKRTWTRYESSAGGRHFAVPLLHILAAAALVGALLPARASGAPVRDPARGGETLLAASPAGAADPDEGQSGSDQALRSARELSEQKRFDQAAARLRTALARDPKNKDVLSLLARVLAWSRRYRESITTYRKLLSIYPNDAFDRAGYARVLAWSGRQNEAIREFRRALAADSTNLESRLGYARALSWDGDLAGASGEYFRILEADSNYGDAWLGLATVARWRSAPTASDAFVRKAAARGADRSGLDEERGAVRLALRPMTGSGWTRSRERQLTSDSTAFRLETVGQFVQGRATLERAVGIALRGSRLHHWEENPGLPTDTTLNYDLRSAGFQGDLSFLRYYPVQIATGASFMRFEARNPRVLYPLGRDDDFFGFNARVWGYAGRFTPGIGVRRDFLPIKTFDTPTGTRVLVPGGVTDAAVSLRWDWSGSGNVTGTFSKATYTDDNERTSLGALAGYRIRAGKPRVALDYGLQWSDFAKPSTSYFTPLESVKHTFGFMASGYSEPAAVDYGARYQFSVLKSGNFDDIVLNAWSAYWDGTLFDALPLGIEGYYSVDNHSYRTWGVTLSGSVRW